MRFSICYEMSQDFFKKPYPRDVNICSKYNKSRIRIYEKNTYFIATRMHSSIIDYSPIVTTNTTTTTTTLDVHFISSQVAPAIAAAENTVSI